MCNVEKKELPLDTQINFNMCLAADLLYYESEGILVFFFKF